MNTQYDNFWIHTNPETFSPFSEQLTLIKVMNDTRNHSTEIIIPKNKSVTLPDNLLNAPLPDSLTKLFPKTRFPETLGDIAWERKSYRSDIDSLKRLLSYIRENDIEDSDSSTFSHIFSRLEWFENIRNINITEEVKKVFTALDELVRETKKTLESKENLGTISQNLWLERYTDHINIELYEIHKIINDFLNDLKYKVVINSWQKWIEEKELIKELIKKSFSPDKIRKLLIESIKQNPDTLNYLYNSSNEISTEMLSDIELSDEGIILKYWSSESAKTTIKYQDIEIHKINQLYSQLIFYKNIKEYIWKEEIFAAELNHIFWLKRQLWLDIQRWINFITGITILTDSFVITLSDWKTNRKKYSEIDMSWNNYLGSSWQILSDIINTQRIYNLLQREPDFFLDKNQENPIKADQD